MASLVPKRSRKWFLTGIFLCLAGHAYAFTLPKLFDLIEANRQAWISMQASGSLIVETEEHTASCTARLLYQRLEERMRLNCEGEDGQTLFIFRTQDTEFELYVAASKKLYRGNIFDLEDAPNLDSHLQPLDFYRALKPMPLSLNATEILAIDAGEYSLGISGAHTLQRKLAVNLSGDIVHENYYDSEDRIKLRIIRDDFHLVRHLQRGNKGVRYPRSIQIENYPNHGEKHWRKTTLRFHDISFSTLLEESEWKIPIPKEAEIINVYQQFFHEAGPNVSGLKS